MARSNYEDTTLPRGYVLSPSTTSLAPPRPVLRKQQWAKKTMSADKGSQHPFDSETYTDSIQRAVAEIDAVIGP